MESSGIIKIERSEAKKPELPENPSEVLKGEGGISLKGGAESTFKVLTSFVGKVFKKMVTGKWLRGKTDSQASSIFPQCSGPV